MNLFNKINTKKNITQTLIKKKKKKKFFFYLLPDL
jgi:hypothetical protein